MTDDRPDEPEELSDLSELAFTFEDSNSKPKDDSSANGLNIDDFNLQGDTDSPLPQPPPVSPTSSPTITKTEDNWLTESLGQVLGPMPFGEVAAMMEAGVLSHSDKVRRASESDWRRLDDIPEFQSQTPSTTQPIKKKKTRTKKLRTRKSESAETKTVTKKKARRKKPKPAEKDELLEEIFSEVFTEDSDVKNPSSDAEPPARQSTTAKASSTPSTHELPTPAPPGSVAATHAAKIPEAGGLGMLAAASQTTPTFQPSKKSASVDLRTVGIIGGIIAVIAICIGLLTYVDLPSFGGPDYETLFADFDSKYSAIDTENIAPDAWQALQKEFSQPVNEAARECMAAGVQDERYLKLSKALSQIITLLSSAPDDHERRKSIYENYKLCLADLK